MFFSYFTARVALNGLEPPGLVQAVGCSWKFGTVKRDAIFTLDVFL
ncbi:MAG: hypothetical protein ACK2U1_11975 [Anaerolineales bacterium]